VTILDAFKSFKPDTAPWISGWTHHLLAVALRAHVVLKALQTLTGLIAAGTVPGQSILCSSRLTALLKPDGGYRQTNSRGRADLPAVHQLSFGISSDPTSSYLSSSVWEPREG
jgi:hypothetical protein